MASMKPTGPTGDDLGHAVQDVVDVHRAAQGLCRALADEDEPEDEGDRQQDVEHAAGDVHPEVADGRESCDGQKPRTRAMATAMPTAVLTNC